MPRSSTQLKIERPSDNRRVTVETPEHELVDLHGCCREEVDAKLHDLLAWAA